MAQAQRGDPEAFRVLYRDIQPRLLRYLHATAGQDAEDIASETWLQVTRDLPAFTGSYDGFRVWVAATAGHILGKRPGAIRTAAHRGLKTLHKKLENGEGEGKLENRVTGSWRSGEPGLTGDTRTRGIPSR